MIDQPGIKDWCAHYEKQAALLGWPTLLNQQEALNTFAEHAAQRSDMGELIGHFQLVQTKKKDAYLIRLAPQRNSLLETCMPLIRLVLLANQGVRLDGTAPAGPLFH